MVNSLILNQYTVCIVYFKEINNYFPYKEKLIQSEGENTLLGSCIRLIPKSLPSRRKTVIPDSAYKIIFGPENGLNGNFRCETLHDFQPINTILLVTNAYKQNS